MIQLEEKRHSRRLVCNPETRAAVLSALEPVSDLQFHVQDVAENISHGGISMVSDKLLPADAVMRVEFVVAQSNYVIPSLPKVQWCDNIRGTDKYIISNRY